MYSKWKVKVWVCQAGWPTCAWADQMLVGMWCLQCFSCQLIQGLSICREALHKPSVVVSQAQKLMNVGSIPGCWVWEYCIHFGCVRLNTILGDVVAQVLHLLMSKVTFARIQLESCYSQLREHTFQLLHAVFKGAARHDYFIQINEALHWGQASRDALHQASKGRNSFTPMVDDDAVSIRRVNDVGSLSRQRTDTAAPARVETAQACSQFSPLPAGQH